jgi:hypothetical protein
MVSGKGSRVGSRSDVRHGLTLDEASRVRDTVRGDKPDIKEVPEDAHRAVMQAPLLLIYLLQGTGEVDRVPYRNGLILPAIALHFPGAVDPDAPVRLVRYRLNRVAQVELFPVDMDDEAIPDDRDPDD